MQNKKSDVNEITDGKDKRGIPPNARKAVQPRNIVVFQVE
jgi:hypothetical protein